MRKNKGESVWRKKVPHAKQLKESQRKAAHRTAAIYSSIFLQLYFSLRRTALHRMEPRRLENKAGD
jgi:hypothetical protein